ncbi:hypothetical protein AX14_010658 [Amanita brunnescens Koide BX004]|nr:hypothetical protein AX14_010658 [Amanita brunnescens Koide BX004]
MRGKDSGEPQSKLSLVSLDLDYLLFGHGCHACPGRFFVVNVIKAILAHILLDYDIKMANGGGCPESIWFGWASLPNTKPEVLFKKRA